MDALLPRSSTGRCRHSYLPAARSSWLLASEMRDLSPRRFMGQAGGSERAGAFLPLTGAVFLRLLVRSFVRTTRRHPSSLLLSPHLADSPSLPCVLRATGSRGDSLFPYTLSSSVLLRWRTLAQQESPLCHLRGPSPVPGLISYCLQQVWRRFRKRSAFPAPLLFVLCDKNLSCSPWGGGVGGWGGGWVGQPPWTENRQRKSRRIDMKG